MQKIKNLHHKVSRIKEIKYLSNLTLNEDLTQQCLKDYGYCFYRNTNLHKDLLNEEISAPTIEHIEKCLYGANYKEQAMYYEHGTDSRKPHQNTSLLSVSEISSTHFVPYHNELCYTKKYPKRIAFICIKPSRFEGYTPIANTVDIYNDLPMNLKNKFIECDGIRYVRNLRDKEMELKIKNNSLDLKGQKFWQEIFDTNDRRKVEYLCDNVYGYNYKWNLCETNKTPILQIMYNESAFISTENNIESFANSLLGMNGRYFNGYNEYYENVEYIDRPFHSLWGNGDEFEDEEIEIMEKLYEKNSICFEWKEGDILMLNNLRWAHARYPYQGERKIVVLMGVPCCRGD